MICFLPGNVPLYHLYTTMVDLMHFVKLIFQGHSGTEFSNNMHSHLNLLWIPELLLSLLKCFLSFSNSESTTCWHLHTWNSLRYKSVFLLLISSRTIISIVMARAQEKVKDPISFVEHLPRTASQLVVISVFLKADILIILAHQGNGKL